MCQAYPKTPKNELKCKERTHGIGNRMQKYGSEIMSTDVVTEAISVYEYRVKPLYDIVSRVIDLLLSFISLVIALPIVLIAAIAIKFEDGGPVFYSQDRLGKDGRIFTIFKMRSMKIDAEANGIQWAETEDNRITKVGKFLRKTRIDEIPQLYNILIGHMKIIGPRPERPELAEEICVDLPQFANRLAVKPGLAGLAQVSGGYDLTPAEKLALDIEYIEQRGFLLDMKIILKTVGVVISGKGAR